MKPVLVLIQAARPAALIIVGSDGRAHLYRAKSPRRFPSYRSSGKREPLTPDAFRDDLLK
jgi:hypothetical protein